MILNKTHELCFEQNNIYQLESCLDKIIVNEDYHGIRILDLSLNTIKIISIMKGLIIFSIYKKYDGTSIMLYSPEQNHLVFINLQTFKYFIIEPRNPLIDYFFDRNYYWQDNTLIFAVENKDIFYQVDFESSTLEQVSQKTVKTLAPSFIDFFKIYKKHNVITVHPDQSSFIYQKNRNLTAFYDYKNKNLILTKHSTGHFEEIYYHNETFIFFDLWNKIIKFKNSKLFLQGIDNYDCLKMSILSNNSIVILLTNKNNHRQCILETYETNNR
jgi:hypothetical protein